VKTIENDKFSGTVTLTDAAGHETVEQRPAIALSKEEASMLRDYKKFLMKYGLREALYCRECDATTHSGTEAWVTDAQIVVLCRHRQLVYFGQTY
jgi:hypothetical protein